MYQRKANHTRKVEGAEFDARELSERLEKAVSLDPTPVFKTKKSFSPSSVGYGNGTCARYWHLAFSGADFVDGADATAAFNMENGTYVHDRLQAAYQKAYGDAVILEKKIIAEDPPIFGFADLIVELDDETLVGEIKSAKQEIFDGIAHRQKPVNYHIVQLLIYMRVLGLKRGFFHYENKNTQEFVIIPLVMNDQLEKYTDEIFEWMRNVHKTWKAGELANPLSLKRTVKACRYCPLKEACLSKPDGTIKIPQLEIAD